MESGEKLVEKIPDVWFDWFARFIPGAAGVLIYYFLHDNGVPNDIDGWTVFFFIMVSYLIGHSLQPLSGRLVKWTELAVDSLFYKGKREDKYVRAKGKKNVNSNLLDKISKAHAEANGMLSISFVLVVNFCVLSNKTISLFAYFLPLYFLAAAVERIFARSRKIDELP